MQVGSIDRCLFPVVIDEFIQRNCLPMKWLSSRRFPARNTTKSGQFEPWHGLQYMWRWCPRRLLRYRKKVTWPLDTRRPALWKIFSTISEHNPFVSVNCIHARTDIGEATGKSGISFIFHRFAKPVRLRQLNIRQAKIGETTGLISLLFQRFCGDERCIM